MVTRPQNEPVLALPSLQSEAQKVDKEIRGLENALKGKSVVELMALSDTVDPKKTIALLKGMLIDDLAAIQTIGISEAVFLDALNCAAGNDLKVVQWLAGEMGVDLDKLNPTGDDILDLEDKKSAVATAPAAPTVLPAVPGTAPATAPAVAATTVSATTSTSASIPSHKIADHLDEDQMDILDLAKKLGNPSNISEVALIIAKKVSKENASARKAFEKAQKKAASGKKMDRLLGGVSSLVARFGKTSNGSGQMEAALDALGLSRKDLMRSETEIAEMVHTQLEKSFDNPEEQQALTSYLKNKDATNPESQEEIDYQIELRNSVEDWAKGTDHEKNYVMYLENGGGQEFPDWADDNVGAITRTFGQIMAFFKGGGSGILGFIAPGMAAKIGTDKPKSTTVKDYKNSVGVKNFEKNKAIANAKEAWKDNMEEIPGMKDQNALLANDAKLFTLLDGQYPDIGPDEYKGMMKAPLREKGATYTQLLEWSGKNNTTGTDTILLNTAGIDFVKNNEVTLNANGKLTYKEELIEDVSALNGMAEALEKSLAWNTDKGKEQKKMYIQHSALFEASGVLPFVTVGGKQIPEMSVDDFEVFAKKHTDVLKVLEKTKGTRLIDTATWEAFVKISDEKGFNVAKNMKEMAALEMNPQDKILALVMMSSTLESLGIKPGEGKKDVPLMKFEENKLQYYRPEGGGGDTNYEVNSQWAYAEFKTDWSVVTYKNKLKQTHKSS